MVPIREVSRLTGINTVTLRAWERRYGLVNPQRTSKGHRLYSLADVKRVQLIQSWLTRGLAIGKVRDLLADTSEDIAAYVPDEDVWKSYGEDLAQILQGLQGRKLQSLLHELFGVYSPEVLADYWLSPALDALSKGQYASASRRALLQQQLREFIYVKTQKLRHQAQGPKVLLINFQTEDDCLALMLAYSLLIKEYAVLLFNDLPPEEWLLVCEQCQCSSVIIYSNQAKGLRELRHSLGEWRNKSIKPLWIAGKVIKPLGLVEDTNPFIAGESVQAAVNHILAQMPVVFRE